MNNPVAIIPSYNEARTIAAIIKEAARYCPAVYVVDDGSSDDTASIARAEGAIVIRNRTNMGKGAALRAGFRYILDRQFDSVIIIDGDGQHEVKSAPDFVKRMEEDGADIVIGNRMLDTKTMPFIRKMTNRFMSFLISKICGQSVPDTQCGYRLIRRAVLEKIKLESSNFEIESELIVKAARAGFKLSSVPIKTLYLDEVSKINPIVDTIRFSIFVMKLGIKR